MSALPLVVDGLRQTTDVVAKHLAQHLVDLAGVELAPQRVAKIALYHRERRLGVRAHVIVLHEVQAVVHEAVVHLCSRGILIGRGLQRVLLEWNERRAAYILARVIRLICRHVPKLEVLGCRLDERNKVVRVPILRAGILSHGDEA